MDHLQRTGHMGDARQPNVCAGEAGRKGSTEARLGAGHPGSVWPEEKSEASGKIGRVLNYSNQ